MIETAGPHHGEPDSTVLNAAGVLDTLPKEQFERYTRLTRRLLDVPIARVNLTNDNPLTKQRVDGKSLMDDPSVRFYAGCPLSSPEGNRLGTLCVIDSEPRTLKSSDMDALRDIAAMVSSELSALRQATTDELTGLSNRRAFNLVASQTLHMCSRDKREATLLVIDLDGFKDINDSLGHAAGDQALIEFARALLCSFRESDVVARLGGDEFCVLLTDTDVSNAWLCVERFRTALDARNEQCGRRHRLKFSAGVIQWNKHEHADVAQLLQAADRMMYARKRAKQLPKVVVTT